MNIVKLERLIAVYEAGSFRKAAKNSGMSQPALTWSIRQLEENLNTILFDRGPRGIQPTSVCERLIVRARLIVSEQQRLIEEVDHSSQTRVIDLGVHPVMLNGDFANTVAQFGVSDPDASLRIVEGYSSELLELLRCGDLDLAYSARPPVMHDQDEFGFEPLARQFYSVFARPDHPVFAEIEGGGLVGAHDWAQVDVPNLAHSPDEEQGLSPLLERVGMMHGAAAVRSSSINFIKALVIDGGMLAMLPDDFVTDDLVEGRLRRVPGTIIEAPPIGILTMRGSFEHRAIHNFKLLLRRGVRAGKSAC